VAQLNNNPARIFSVQFIYQVFLKENSSLKMSFENKTLTQSDYTDLISDFLTTYLEPDNEHPDSTVHPVQLNYGKKILDYLLENYESISNTLDQNIESSLDSLTPFDRSALLIGISEIKSELAPFQVVTNEMVNICKTYGSESSPRFINGVLDGIGKSSTPS
jgi:N utilization substance protein B